MKALKELERLENLIELQKSTINTIERLQKKLFTESVPVGIRTINGKIHGGFIKSFDGENLEIVSKEKGVHIERLCNITMIFFFTIKDIRKGDERTSIADEFNNRFFTIASRTQVQFPKYHIKKVMKDLEKIMAKKTPSFSEAQKLLLEKYR